MNRILFFDLINDGHHFFYNYNVMKIDGIEEKIYLTGSEIEKEKEKLIIDTGTKIMKIKECKSNNQFIRIITQVAILHKLRKVLRKHNITTAMLLYLDHIIIPLYLIQFLSPFKCNIWGTLHWFPNRGLKIKLLKKLCDRGLSVIVHTEDIKNKLHSIGVDNVEVIYYPTLETKDISGEEAKNKLNLKLNNANSTILYFGGTRYDKGLDILLDSLQFINTNINVIIAGQEQHFKREYIEAKISNLNNINIHLNLGYIKDQDIEMYFKASDIVVLPYRKMFNGESGILTEAINNKNIVIVPDIIHFPQVIKQYSNGIVYNAENPKDLAEKIEYVTSNISEFESGTDTAYKEYKEKHSLEVFIQRYKELI